MSEGGPLIHLEWQAAEELVRQAQKIVTVTHIYPDGDAIGSMMGLTLALREHEKTVTPVVDGGLPSRFAFVPHSSDIVAEAPDQKPDLVISTDASDLDRLGKAGAALRQYDCPLLQLDHHQTNLLFGDTNLVDARTVAAAEGVLDWLERLGWEVSPPVAQALLTGIVTDTLCFRTNNVTANLMGKVQALMQAGADLNNIVQRTLATQPIGLIRLYGRVLPRLHFEDEVIWVTVTPDDYRSSAVTVGEYNGLSSYLVQADKAAIAAVFKLMDDGSIDVSMRAVPGYDVSQVALELGGGGHVLASGCTLNNMSLEESTALVIPRLKAETARGQRLYD